MDIKFRISVLLIKPLLVRLIELFIPHRFVVRFYLSSFFKSFTSLPNDLVLSVVSGYGKNLKMALRINDKLNPQETHYWLGFQELDVQRLFARVVKKNFIVYDIGAYFGFYSLLAGRLAGCAGKVYAFEPFPRNIERLKLHISLNRMQDTVFCIPKMVTDRTGKCLYRNLGRDDWGRFVNIDCSEEGHSNKTGLLSEAVSLDDFVFQEGYPAPNLIKIDVEGAEGKVIIGAQRLLKKFKPVIICELHSQESAIQVYKELMLLEYRLKDLDSGEIRHIVAWPKE